MTKKDYELIARVLNKLALETGDTRYAYQFADALAATNPRFNRTRFIMACLKGTILM